MRRAIFTFLIIVFAHSASNAVSFVGGGNLGGINNSGILGGINGSGGLGNTNGSSGILRPGTKLPNDSLINWITANNDPTQSIYQTPSPIAFSTDCKLEDSEKQASCCPTDTTFDSFDRTTKTVNCIKDDYCGDNMSFQYYTLSYYPPTGGVFSAAFSSYYTIQVCKCNPGYYKNNKRCIKCPEAKEGINKSDIITTSSDFKADDLTQDITGCYIVVQRAQTKSAQQATSRNMSSKELTPSDIYENTNTTPESQRGKATVRYYYSDKDKDYVFEQSKAQAIVTACATGQTQLTTNVYHDGVNLEWGACVPTSQQAYSPATDTKQYFCPPYLAPDGDKLNGYLYTPSYLAKWETSFGENNDANEDTFGLGIENCRPSNTHIYTDAKGSFYYDISSCTVTDPTYTGPELIRL